MVREIPKDGKVWRLTKESWDTLRPFDTDPNEGIRKMQALITELEKQAKTEKLVTDIIRQPDSATVYTDEKKLRIIVKEEMESVIAPFTGG